MVKVQNGWQAHSLDEVENLASQQASPISNPSVLHASRQFQQSPGTSVAASRRGRSGFSQSPERNTDATMLQYHTEHGNVASGPGVPTHPYQFTIDKQISTSTKEAPTYESFWRQHSAKPTTRYAQEHSSNSSGPSLEPPADIVSRNSRRSNLQHLQPPSLYTNNLSNLSTSSEASARSLIPATPPPQKRVTAIRTPSQNAAMEKDAVETLLFMSSPVNSGYIPQSGHVPGTPVRNAYRTAGKRVEFAGASGGLESSDEEQGSLDRVLPRQSTSRGLGRTDKEDDIDKMLDAMGDGDSSSEDDIEIHLQ